MKFQLGDRVELTDAAKVMFPRLALAQGAIAGRLPKADYLPFRVCWDTKSHHESYSAELLQLVSDTIATPRSQHEALMAAAKALEPFDEFAAKIEKERPGWYHDQFSFLHSVGGEYDVPMTWFIGARKALAALRAAGVIEEEGK